MANGTPPGNLSLFLYYLQHVSSHLLVLVLVLLSKTLVPVYKTTLFPICSFPGKLSDSPSVPLCLFHIPGTLLFWCPVPDHSPGTEYWSRMLTHL
jgi:hypothetical protein